MATLNPRSLFRQVFPTARRLLVERDAKRWFINDYKRVLVIGAGHDPYRGYFLNADFYLALDIIVTPGSTEIIADGTALPFEDSSFDCVVALEVMEHVKNPIKLIEEAYRVLSPDGHLLLSVPFIFHQHGDPSDYWRPTMLALKMATSRFVSSDIYHQGNRIHAISDLITTAFYPRSVFWPLRIVNHLIVHPFSRLSSRQSGGSAPSGFFVVASK